MDSVIEVSGSSLSERVSLKINDKCNMWLSPCLQQYLYSTILLWPPAGRWPFCFTTVVLFFFLLPHLQGCLAERHQTLPHVQWWPRFIKFGRNFGPFPPKKFGGPKTSKFWRDFAQLRDLIANISGTQQTSIGKWRCKLWTLPHRQT